MIFDHWLYFVAAFLIVVAVLAAGVIAENWWAGRCVAPIRSNSHPPGGSQEPPP